LKLIGLLYILGVSVAGMPLVLVALFFRGFVLGFASAFILGALHWQGVALTMVAIVLQNIFIIPAIVIVAGVALGFSWQLISSKNRALYAQTSVSQRFAAYTALVLAMGLVVLVGTALEAYAAPFLMHLFSAWGI
jgi:stage II sporulation protein M